MSPSKDKDKDAHRNHRFTDWHGKIGTEMSTRKARNPRFFSPATRCNFILYSVDKQLNKDSRNQATEKSYPQPEHIFPYTSKPQYENTQKTHHSSEKGFQFHSTLPGGRANLGRRSAIHGRMVLPPQEKS